MEVCLDCRTFIVIELELYGKTRPAKQQKLSVLRSYIFNRRVTKDVAPGAIGLTVCFGAAAFLPVLLPF